MFNQISDPEISLAIAYSPRVAQSKLRTLFQMDERFASVLNLASDPSLRLIRYAWWREALQTLSSASAPGDPLLQRIIDELLPIGLRGQDLTSLVDGWSEIAAIEPGQEIDALARFADLRGGALFNLAAMRLTSGDIPDWVPAVGRSWALIDFARRFPNSPLSLQALEMGREHIIRKPWPRSLRSLGMLALLAYRDAQRGLDAWRPGSPARMARMMVHYLTGR